MLRCPLAGRSIAHFSIVLDIFFYTMLIAVVGKNVVEITAYQRETCTGPTVFERPEICELGKEMKLYSSHACYKS